MAVSDVRPEGPRIVWSAPLRRPLEAVVREITILPRGRVSRALKRAIDLVGASAGMVMLAPVFAATYAAVRATSKGPVLFVQDRVGVGGRRFKFYKFRTMVEDAEERKAGLAHLNVIVGPAFKVTADPRVTAVGAFLRKYSLDELPQLFNVLVGDMSLVGPRPPTVDEVEQYSTKQAQRLAVMPGVTGLWQVSGRADIEDFDRWIELDVQYAKTWSVWLDLAILAKTPFIVIQARGAR